MEYKLNARNTLFPSEMKLLLNTLLSIRSVWTRKRYYANRGRFTTEPKVGIYPEEQLFIDRCIKEQDDQIRLGNIWKYIENQHEFLSTYVGEDYKVKECQFIAKRLEVILPKMEARVRELYEIKLDQQFADEFGCNTCVENSGGACDGCPNYILL